MMYKRFFDATGDMRLVSSGRGKLIDVNQAGVELFGYCSKEELLGLENVSLLFSNPEDGTQFQQRLEADGFLKEYEAELKKKDGTVFSASITATLSFEDDGSISWEGALRDITGLKELQEAYQEAERQYRELSVSERSIRELNQHILNMLMIMSHDIRGPLVSIAATLKLLLRGSFGRMDESVWNTVSDLMARVRHLIGIAEDCLGSAHSMEGALLKKRECIDLRQDIIDAVLDEMSNEIEERRIMIDNRLGAIPAGSISISRRYDVAESRLQKPFQKRYKIWRERLQDCFWVRRPRLLLSTERSTIAAIRFRQQYRDSCFLRSFLSIDGRSRRKRMASAMGLYIIREIVRNTRATCGTNPGMTALISSLSCQKQVSKLISL